MGKDGIHSVFTHFLFKDVIDLLNQFLKVVDDRIIFTGDMLEFYIPMTYFESNNAYFDGSEVVSLGVFWVRGFKDGSDKPLFTETLKLSSWITMFPSAVRVANVTITGFEKDPRCQVLTFYKNTPVMYSYIKQDSDNIQKFLDMILAGKIVNIPYQSLLALWDKNLQINGTGLDVPASSKEIVLSEMYSAKDDPDITYGYAKNLNPKLHDCEYNSRNIRDICSRSSTFAALAFEDFDTMLAASLNMNKEHKKQNISPLEKVIKY